MVRSRFHARRRFVVAAFALIVAVFASRDASAAGGGDAERAAALFKQAQLAFEKKAFGAAAAAFEEAAQLTPHAATWLNAGEARERDGNFPSAVADYDRALEIEGASDAHKREAKTRIQRLEAKVATIEIAATTATIVRIDARQEITAPRVMRLAPGHHTIEILVKPPRTIETDVGAGERKRIDVASDAQQAPPPPPPPQQPTPPPPPPPPTSSGPPTVSWIAFGTAAAAAGVGAVFGAMTVSAKSSFTEAPTIDRRDAFYRDRTITNVAFLVAGVAALTGVGLWIALPSKSSSSAAVITPMGAAGTF